MGTLADPRVGIGLAIAIGIHNVPEGLCVSVPIYYATKVLGLVKCARRSG